MAGGRGPHRPLALAGAQPVRAGGCWGAPIRCNGNTSGDATRSVDSVVVGLLDGAPVVAIVGPETMIGWRRSPACIWTTARRISNDRAARGPVATGPRA